MTRSQSEIIEEVRAIGFEMGQFVASVLARHLDEGENILDAVPGQRWLPHQYKAFGAWLVVTPKRALVLAIERKGWFTPESLQDLTPLPLSDIREVSWKFTNGEGRWAGVPGHEIIVRTLASQQSISVPLDIATAEVVRKFVEVIEARCLREHRPGSADMSTSDTQPPVRRSFAEEISWLRELESDGHLTRDEVAQAIRKLLAT